MSNDLRCPLLWNNILTENDGTFRTCCHGKDIAVTDQGVPMTRLTHSVTEVFNSKWLDNIRTNVANGIRDSNCDYCWQLEAVGVESFRQTNLNILGNTNQTPNLEILDLSLGNQCNLKCRTCTPEDSSVWIREAYDLDTAQTESFSDYQRKMIVLEPDDSKFFEDLKQHLNTVEIIKMFGGEPFLMKRTWQLLREAVRIGRSQDIELYFNTNCTLWEPSNVELFDHFKKVEIGLSIDGVGSRFEYMRHPAKWDLVHHNIKQMAAWREAMPNRRLLLTHTVSAYNIWYVHEAVQLAEQYGLHLYINLCLQPEDSFAIQHLPANLKARTDAHVRETVDSTSIHWSEITKLLNYPSEGTDCSTWFNEVTKRDKYRNESFKDTFPEYYQILVEMEKIDDTSI